MAKNRKKNQKNQNASNGENFKNYCAGISLLGMLLLAYLKFFM